MTEGPVQLNPLIHSRIWSVVLRERMASAISIRCVSASKPSKCLRSLIINAIAANGSPPSSSAIAASLDLARYSSRVAMGPRAPRAALRCASVVTMLLSVSVFVCEPLQVAVLIDAGPCGWIG